mmetsp:Transcript_36325/g.104586  ORF Transcript_36325/g.104586 Transcript_36325/m.104586 type:complete len:367 (+) Transcript_36325:119-1219(+)
MLLSMSPAPTRSSSLVSSSSSLEAGSSDSSSAAKVAEPMPDKWPAQTTTPESNDGGDLCGCCCCAAPSESSTDEAPSVLATLGEDKGLVPLLVSSAKSTSPRLPVAVLWMTSKPAAIKSTQNQYNTWRPTCSWSISLKTQHPVTHATTMWLPSKSVTTKSALYSWSALVIKGIFAKAMAIPQSNTTYGSQSAHALQSPLCTELRKHPSPADIKYMFPAMPPAMAESATPRALSPVPLGRMRKVTMHTARKAPKVKTKLTKRRLMNTLRIHSKVSSVVWWGPRADVSAAPTNTKPEPTTCLGDTRSPSVSGAEAVFQTISKPFKGAMIACGASAYAVMSNNGPINVVMKIPANLKARAVRFDSALAE